MNYLHTTGDTGLSTAGFTLAPPVQAGAWPFVFHYARAWKLQVAGLLVLVLLAAGCAVAVQYVMKVLVDAMTGARDGALATQTLVAFIGLIAVESLLWRATGWLCCRSTISIGVAVRLDLFRYLSGHAIRYFSDNLAGSLGHRLTATAGNLGALTNTMIWKIVPPCVDFAGALIIFSMISAGMAAALAIAVGVLVIGLIAYGKRGRHLHQRYAQKAAETTGDLTDTIGNMWAVKAFSARERELERLRLRFINEGRSQSASWMYTEKARLLHDFALWVLAGGMLYWAIALWGEGAITPGDVVLVSAMTFRILHGSRELALALVDIVQQFGFIDDTLRVIGERQGFTDSPEARPVQSGGHGAIEFRNVRFRYGPGTEVIHEINLSIPPGQKVGIVGPSGAGKSTIVHLLQRLSDTQQGEILIDGQPLTSVQQDSLRDILAVVPQEIILFHRSVRDNILFARPGASEWEVRAAARAAQCEGFIARLPQGYDTLVGERGAKLSGGQRQRIGIARAFLKASPIIILDEATSALDTQSEMEIQKALIEILGEKTVISVAHRLSTLSNFDRILVIEDGRIVDDATPAQLRSRPGVFSRMWRLQAEGLAAEVA